MVDPIKCNISWNLYLKNFKTYMKEDQFLESIPFSSAYCPSVVWELRVYPNSHANSSSFYSSEGSFVSLVKKGPLNNSIKAKYNIYALNSYKTMRIVVATSNGFNFTNQRTETPKYSIDFSNSYEFGEFILCCEIEFAPFDKCIEIINNEPGTSNTHKPFNNMFKQGILTDCVIKVGNEQINTHRCVLASNSVVFHRMFEQKGMIEEQNGEINIVDSSPQCVHAMIDYFYNGEIKKEILEKLVYELFAIAHKYEVKSLMDKCEQIMAIKIDAKNFATCVYYLQLYNLPFLENACIKYITTNRKTFLYSNEWKNLKELYKDKAVNLIELAFKNF